MTFAELRAAPEEFAPARRRAVRIGLHALWVIGLSLAVTAGTGRFGFFPADQGFILGQARRILNGEIPHSDIISARPLGSAVIHILDFALPGPLFLASAVLSMAEIIMGTIALAVIVTNRPLLTWGPGRTALVAAAAVLNLNAFPLMAWHTIDGITLTACGVWALRSDSVRVRRLGLFLFGVAALVKQSFAPVVVIAGLWLLLRPRGKRSFADFCWLGAFPLAYVTVVSLDGGFGAMVDQLTTAAPAYGEGLLGFWLTELPTSIKPLPLFVFAAIAAVALVARTAWSSWLLLLTGITAVAWVVADGGFVGPNRWTDALWWILAVAIVVHGLLRRAIPWGALLVLGLGFLISLSWGQDTPTLLAGSMALTTCFLLADLVTPPDGLLRTGTAACMAVFVIVGLVTVSLRDDLTYMDRPRAELTRDLGDVAPSMHGIRTNEGTYTYLAQLRDCLKRFPADKVAVLADNPFAYAAFDLRNPFPVDWPLPLEMVADAPQRMIAAAHDLNRHGSYLVLFQTVDQKTLMAGGPVPAEVRPDQPIYDYFGIAAHVKAALAGETITCGNFVGKWQS
ncbi:hypothetical protein [Amycolatopsis xylanica]|uniref:hypothetical protein n=1 Tax=Amycolatopsis xylanica TaxID=589385 RepID=UPI001FDEE501|nr:hypothetical protein [Amycolatopsis xylanica]